jgi:hypothetical protein
MKKPFVLLVICMLIIVACSPTAPADPTPFPVPVNPTQPLPLAQQLIFQLKFGKETVE